MNRKLFIITLIMLLLLGTGCASGFDSASVQATVDASLQGLQDSDFGKRQEEEMAVVEDGPHVVTPTPESFVVATPTPEAGPTATVNPEVITYIVQPGDTLFSIARRHNVTVGDIQRDNNIPDANKIYPGQELTIVLRATSRMRRYEFGDHEYYHDNA